MKTKLFPKNFWRMDSRNLNVEWSDVRFSLFPHIREGWGEGREGSAGLFTVRRAQRIHPSPSIPLLIEGRRKSTAGTFCFSRSAFAIAISLLMVGCAVGPDYKRPMVNTPTTFRTAASDTNPPASEPSLGDVEWWNAFNEPQLKALIDEALTNSFDIQIAAARVLQAEASLRITRSQFLPSVNAGGDLLTSRTSERGPSGVPRGVNPQLVRNVRSALDREGFHRVRITASGGFTPEKIRRFENEGVPVDSYGVGSSLFRGQFDFTADIVVVDGAPGAKAGRWYRPNPRLEIVS